jgi:hypothetical protein
LGWRKRAPTTWLPVARGQPVTVQVGAKAVGYRLQEGSLILAQEGVNPWSNWLQEGSLGATQEGVDGVVWWPHEGGLVVVQVGIAVHNKWTAGGTFLWSTAVDGVVGRLCAQLGTARGTLPAGGGEKWSSA